LFLSSLVVIAPLSFSFFRHHTYCLAFHELFFEMTILAPPPGYGCSPFPLSMWELLTIGVDGVTTFKLGSLQLGFDSCSPPCPPT
jgi:hypothetical protein